MSELLESSDEHLKFKVAQTVLNAANEWQRKEAPGHTTAEDRLRKEQLDATMRISGWEKQYVAQGGKAEDLLVAMATGAFDPHAELRAKMEEMNSNGKPDAAPKPDKPEEKDNKHSTSVGGNRAPAI